MAIILLTLLPDLLVNPPAIRVGPISSRPKIGNVSCASAAIREPSENQWIVSNCAGNYDVGHCSSRVTIISRITATSRYFPRRNVTWTIWIVVRHLRKQSAANETRERENKCECKDVASHGLVVRGSGCDAAGIVLRTLRIERVKLKDERLL